MSESPGFVATYNRFRAEHPKATEQELYYATIEATDGLCHHPVQWREELDLKNGNCLFCGNRPGRRLVETYCACDLPPRGPDCFWYCPICGYEHWPWRPTEPVNILEEKRRRLVSFLLEVAAQEPKP